MPTGNPNRTGTPFPPGVAKPALRALAAADYTHLEGLANVEESALLALHGMGSKAIRTLRDALEGMGLAFKEPR